MNKVLLTGRITKDPEVRYTQSGIASVSFSIAVDRQFRDQNGNRQADFINCVAWRQQADFMGKYIKKGYMLAIEGRITTRSYQTPDNQTRYVTEVVVDSIENMQPRDPNQAGQSYDGGYQQPQQQNPYQGYNNPSYGQRAPQQPAYQQSYQQPQPEAPQSFNVEVSDDDLPF